MTPAILVTLFCFLPTGIAAIVFASQVQSKWTVGDFAGAAEASRKARLYVVVSVLAGCLAWVILIAIGFASTPSTPTAPTP
ncbi:MULTISPECIES: CD225/dispanin family protein [Streptomyces]|uniref:CD225/dispanin family protein n=1 Tax=Streptomyces TaxID=1883 RepID=UPI00131B4C0D|nr:MULTISPECIES: CD225/dispanin family protein [Streptomyces]